MFDYTKLPEEEKKAYLALGESYYCKYAGVRNFSCCKEWEYYELVSFGWADETHGMDAAERENFVKKAILTHMVGEILCDLRLYATQWRDTLVPVPQYPHKRKFLGFVNRIKTMWANNPYALRESVRDIEYHASERGWVKEKSLDFVYNDGRGKTYRTKYEAEYAMIKGLAKSKDFKDMTAALDVYKNWCN